MRELSFFAAAISSTLMASGKPRKNCYVDFSRTLSNAREIAGDSRIRIVFDNKTQGLAVTAADEYRPDRVGARPTQHLCILIGPYHSLTM